MPASIAAKIKNGQIFILSARVPDTIDTVVAQKTIWKNQSDPSEYPVANVLASLQGIKDPIKPPSGIP